MKKGRLDEFCTEEDKLSVASMWIPLTNAMAAGVKELEMSPEDFVKAIRCAISANVYKHVYAPDGSDYPTILAMKITII